MLLKEPLFMKEEGRAPLFMQNKEYLFKLSNIKIAWQKTRIWSEYLLDIQIDKNNKTFTYYDIDQKLDESNTENINNKNENKSNENESKNQNIPSYGLKVIAKPSRIILRDAERTFSTKAKQDLLICLLTAVEKTLSDYQQTISYVSGILLLFFDVETTFRMLFVLGRSPKYALSGYWRSEAIGQAIDACAMNDMLETLLPKLHLHLKTIGILPETFIAKWFGGLCVQIMPIEYLMDFWTQFFHLGYRYLFKFAISLMAMLETCLLSTVVEYRIYEILRLDAKSKFYDCDEVIHVLNDGNSGSGSGNGDVCMENIHTIDKKIKIHIFFTQLLANANSFGMQGNFDELDFGVCREKAFEKHLKQRLMNSATAVHLQSLSIDADDDDENEDCAFCEDGFAEFYCAECDEYVCEDCQENPSGDHNLNHSVKILVLDCD